MEHLRAAVVRLRHGSNVCSLRVSRVRCPAAPAQPARLSASFVTSPRLPLSHPLFLRRLSSTASSPSPVSQFAPLSSFPPLSSLRPIYSHDRSTYFRRLTVFSSASLVLLWLPLSYVSLAIAHPPLYATLIGPVATLAIIVATAMRASRVISSIHFLDPGTLIIVVHTGTGKHAAAAVPLRSVVRTDSIVQRAASPSPGAEGSGYWPISLAGHKRFFLIDKQGTIGDRQAMRSIIGSAPELDSEEERKRAEHARMSGPPSLKGFRPK